MTPTMKRAKSHGWGHCVCPDAGAPMLLPWFLDNGAFMAYRDGIPFPDDAFRGALEMAKTHEEPPEFVVVPDSVGNRPETLEMAAYWFPRLEGLPLYFAAQDEMTIKDYDLLASYGAAGVFIGGTLEWKFSNGESICRWARSNSLKVHIGRIGSYKTITWAKYIGANSIDSTQPLWERKRMRRAYNALSQGMLFTAEDMNED